MMTVGQLAQHFLTIEPQKSPARLAFYHYLKNFLPLQAQFKPEMIDGFYDRAMCMNHWQINKQSLGEVIKSDLAAIGARHPIGIDLDLVVHSHEMQVIVLEQPRDFAALLAREVTKFEKAGEKVKSFRMNGDKTAGRQEVMILRLSKTGSIIVEIRQNIAILVDGELQLVRPHSRLSYNAELDFESNVDQFLTTSLLRVAKFTCGADGKVKGSIIQGASFHCAENFDRRMDELPELFQAVKNIERFYINPVTDTYYQQLVENYEQALNEKTI